MERNGTSSRRFYEEADPNVKAKIYGDKVAEEIAHRSDRTQIRQRIMALFRDGETSEKIAETVNGSMELRIGVTKATASTIVRKVIQILAPEEERKKMNSEKHRRKIRKHLHTVMTGRNEWMENEGYFVWSEDQAQYFMTLLLDDSYQKPESRQSKARRKKEGNRERKRRAPMDHVKLSAEMNRRFETDVFSPDVTRAKLERIRTETNKRRSKEQ